MKLTSAQIKHFMDFGYVAVEQFFGPVEIAAMRIELDRLMKDGLLRNVATDGDGKTVSSKKKNMQICPMNDRSEFFRALPFQSKVIAAITHLIGEPVVVRLDQCFWKPAKIGMGTNWHQDNAYFKIPDPMRGCAMWIAVHDATVANGTMHVIPGSARETYEHTRDPQSDHHVRCHPPEDRAVPIELKAGGVLFFAYGTAHCTRDNTTDHDRAGVAFHFVAEKFDTPENSGHIRPLLTGSKASWGLKEYGVSQQGRWEKSVAAGH